MELWSATFVSIFTVGLLYYFYRDKLVWWEPLLLLFVPTLIAFFISWGAKSYLVVDYEWLTDYAVKLEHREPYVREWEEYVPEVGHTDSKGNYVVDVPAHWETITEHHPEKWIAITSLGGEFLIKNNEYNKYKSLWGKEKYIDLHHPDQRHYPGDGRGDMFETYWTGERTKVKPVTWEQRWENRIQASNESIFKFPDVDEETKKQLFDLPHPDENHNTPAILGDGGHTQASADKALMQWNALLGPRSANEYEKAVRMWILVFKNATSDIAYEQENYWKGGNKNELTLCVGVDNNYKIKWAYVISWTSSEKIKIDIRNFVQRDRLNETLDLNEVVNYMGQQAKDNFARMREREFAHLEVKPPVWSIWTIWIITILLNIGIGAFVCLNDFDKDNPSGATGYRSRYRRLHRYKLKPRRFN